MPLQWQQFDIFGWSLRTEQIKISLVIEMNVTDIDQTDLHRA
jgi:hypothetical protein